MKALAAGRASRPKTLGIFPSTSRENVTGFLRTHVAGLSRDADEIVAAIAITETESYEIELFYL